MNQKETIKEMKTICIDIAANFEVPPALVEIILIKRLSELQKTRQMIPEYIKEGHLYRLLVNWKGRFLSIGQADQVWLQFSDGTIVGDKKDDHLHTFSWDELTRIIHPKPNSALYRRIRETLIARITGLV
ncbi:hypothetical protein [Chitinophaga sp. OAE865]|uniref:hypothetical protein n=1 Tax=Chitinophaga sp. OAE865 TaxID=2817898 RepID=UPI001AEBA58C